MSMLIVVVISIICLLQCYQAEERTFISVYHTKKSLEMNAQFTKQVSPKLCDKENTNDKLASWAKCTEEYEGKYKEYVDQHLIEVIN